MQVQKLSNINITRKTDYLANPRYKETKYNISFGNKEDVFVRMADSTFATASRALREKLQKVLTESNQNIKYSSIVDEIRAIAGRNAKIADISEKYKVIIEGLKNSSNENRPKDAEAINRFIEGLEKLGQNEGFNKVFGYQNIKKKLENEFILGKIMMERTSQEVNVPNAVLMFGPSCNGKSFFAGALAEHTLSHSETVDLAKLGKEAREKGVSKERLAMDKIKEYAEIAKKNYIENDKQRTIIIVNEADNLAKPSSPVFKEFSDFIANCSKEHKCTLFLTTNYPERFDKSVLSKDITPFKIGIEPANRDNCKEIICGVLNRHGKLLEKGIDKLVDAFFRNHNKTYSNGNIVDIITNTVNEFKPKTPSLEDYLEVIERNDVAPSIAKEDLESFYTKKKQLEGIN